MQTLAEATNEHV